MTPHESKMIEQGFKFNGTNWFKPKEFTVCRRMAIPIKCSEDTSYKYQNELPILINFDEHNIVGRCINISDVGGILIADMELTRSGGELYDSGVCSISFGAEWQYGSGYELGTIKNISFVSNPPDHQNPYANVEEDEEIDVRDSYWRDAGVIFHGELVVGNSTNLVLDDAKRKQEKIDRVRLKQCEAEAENSNCVKHSVGCIITDVDGRILSSGYNGTPSGHENCCHKFPNFQETVDRLDQIISNENQLDITFKRDAKISRDSLFKTHREWSMTHEIHAEVNALLNSDPTLREGGTLYVNLQPCPNCAKMIAASGVKRVVFGKPYHRADDEVSRDIFNDSGIDYIFYPNVIE